MSKRVRMLVLCVFILFVAGCVDRWTGQEETLAHRRFDAFSSSGSCMTVTGLYELEYLLDSAGYLLTYRGEGAAQSQIVCWRPDCGHNTSDCPAYYGEGYALLDTDEKGRVYLLECGMDHTLTIWQIDPLEASKNSVGTYALPKPETGTIQESIRYSAFCLYDHVLYLMIPMGTEEDNVYYKKLFGLDLRDKEWQELLYDETGSLQPLVVSEEGIYIEYEDSQTQYILEKYTFGAGQTEELMRSDFHMAVVDGEIVYKIKNENGYAWKAREEVTQLEKELGPTTQKAIPGISDMMYAGYVSVMMESEEEPLYWLNVHTGEKKRYYGAYDFIADVNGELAAVKQYHDTGNWILRLVDINE